MVISRADPALVTTGWGVALTNCRADSQDQKNRFSRVKDGGCWAGGQRGSRRRLDRCAGSRYSVTTSSHEQIGWRTRSHIELFRRQLSGIGMQRPCATPSSPPRSAVAQFFGSSGRWSETRAGINQGNASRASPWRWGSDRGSWPPAAPWRHWIGTHGWCR